MIPSIETDCTKTLQKVLLNLKCYSPPIITNAAQIIPTLYLNMSSVSSISWYIRQLSSLLKSFIVANSNFMCQQG